MDNQTGRQEQHPIVDITIIGGGPTGLFGAFYGGLRGMSVRIIDSLPELGGQMNALYPEKFIYDMPGFPKILGADLAKNLVEQAMRFHPKVHLNTTATELTRTANGYEITSKNGEVFPTRTVLVTAGAGAFSPKEIGVENEQAYAGNGIYYSVEDKQAFAGKKLAVVGGGNSACDWALSLEPIAESVTLIHRRDVFRAHESTVSKLGDSKVDVKLWTVVKSVFGNGRLKGIEIDNVKTQESGWLDVDAVLVNVGFRSALGYIKQWGLETDRNHILVNRNFHTNLPGVYAAGDICDYPGKLKLIATGVGEAATAVCFAKVFIDPEAKLYPGHSSDKKDI